MKRSVWVVLVLWLGATLSLVLILMRFLPSARTTNPRAEWLSSPASEQADRISEIALRSPPADPQLRPVPPPSNMFVVTDGLRPSVDFWKRVFSEINSYQAIIHDSYDLSRVYGIVDLRDEPGAQQGNQYSLRRAAQSVLRRYVDHLQYLTAAQRNPARLAGERLRLFYLIRASGGIEAHEGASGRVRIQRGLRDTFAASISRSGRYITEYRRIFRQRGLPEELALLPHLESSFTYDARSYAGAVGIWQLTSAAARRLLHISSAVDERLDPWSSAEAAARILEDNYRTFRSWPLAVTAYNQGPGNVRRAIRGTGSNRIETIIRRYSSRSFRFVGRNFYCCFLAILEVARDYEEYFGELPIDPELQIVRHRVSQSAPLSSICRDLGVEPEEIAELNPALRRHAFSEGTRLPRGMHLNLPAEAN